MVACGLVGARAYFVIKEWSNFQRPTLAETLLAIVNIPEGGLVVYGSLLGGVLAFVVYTLRHRLSMLSVADIVAPSMMIGLALGRIGCFLNGCCFGGECDWPGRFASRGRVRRISSMCAGLVYLHGIKIVADEQDKPIVKDVAPNSLAAAQGLKAGQRILLVQGLPAVNARFVEDALLSIPANESQVTIVTEGATEPRRWTLSLADERSRPIHPAQLYATIGACWSWCCCWPGNRIAGPMARCSPCFWSCTPPCGSSKRCCGADRDEPEYAAEERSWISAWD